MNSPCLTGVYPLQEISKIFVDQRVWLERVFVWAGGAPAGGLESKSSTFSEKRACVVVCVVTVPSLPESGRVAVCLWMWSERQHHCGKSA